MPYYLKSQLIKEFSHGFFLRRGGSSKGKFESLNCDLKSSDHESTVLKNRDLVAKTLEIESKNLITLNCLNNLLLRNSRWAWELPRRLDKCRDRVTVKMTCCSWCLVK